MQMNNAMQQTLSTAKYVVTAAPISLNESDIELLASFDESDTSSRVLSNLSAALSASVSFVLFSFSSDERRSISFAHSFG